MLKVSATGRRSGKNVRKVNIWRESRKVERGTRSQRPVVYSEYPLFLPLPPLPDSSTKNSPLLQRWEQVVVLFAIQLFVLLNALRQHVPQIYSGRQILSFYCSLCVGCINNLKCTIEFHSVKFYFIPCIILCESIPMYMKCIINLFALQKMPCFNFIL